MDLLSTKAGEDAHALRSALRHAVQGICEAEQGRGRAMDADAVSSLAFTLEQYIKRLGVDLSAFAKHAKRATIGVDDVLLVARHNRALGSFLDDFVLSHDLKPAKAAPKKRKRPDDPKPRPLAAPPAHRRADDEDEADRDEPEYGTHSHEEALRDADEAHAEEEAASEIAWDW
ncbi:kinetochore component CENP-S-domain-containing protein [Pelagophyceae sp. CCMP2097]|nr:kinetochore component CENP-S-domain-containing protein [Pelagophyceae sp. CCMP2097]